MQMDIYNFESIAISGNWLAGDLQGKTQERPLLLSSNQKEGESKGKGTQLDVF